MIIQQHSALNYLLGMQAAVHRQSLLDTFIDYCLRSKSYCCQIASPTRTTLQYNRAPIHRKMKPHPNLIKSPFNFTDMRQRQKGVDAKKEKVLQCRQMLNITPKAVFAACEPMKKSQVRANSTITFKRRSSRPKTQESSTQRSSSPFLTQQKYKDTSETLNDNDCFEEVSKNRPFTACPLGNNSINRLRTIQIELPKHKKIGRIMTSFDDSLSAWETPFP